MGDRYVPGEWAHRYHRLKPADRNIVSAEADKRFKQRTGVATRLDPHDVRQRELVRQWLRIRDEVMAERASAVPILAPPAPAGPKLAIPTDQQEALGLVDAMLARTGPVAFSGFRREDIGLGLRARILNPGLINQGGAGLCPVASILFTLAQSDPVGYATLVIDLLEKGQGRLDQWEIRPRMDLRAYTPPAGVVSGVDWIPLASIRDSENWIFHYNEVDSSDSWLRKLGGWDMWNGGAHPGELAKWFRKLGYTDVINETNGFITKDRATLEEAGRKRQKGYKVVLSIDAGVLDADVLEKPAPGLLSQSNHFVVLTSPVVISASGGNTVVDLTVFTWGQGRWPVRPGGKPMPLDRFLKYFYGYVAANR
jgi:hypothetical protein